MRQVKRVFKWGLVLVLLGVAAWMGTTILRNQNSASQTSDLTQVVAVTRGNLVAAITPTGEVYAPRQVELSFDVTKVPLIELNVAAGQQVEAGQVLARIDPSSLQRAVDQAKAELLSAEDALEKAKNPYTELDRRKAELAVTQAETALEEARQKLNDLLNPDLSEAEKAVRQAEFNLESARLNLIIAQHSTTAGKTVRDLEYSVAWHERKLRDLEAQYRQNKIAQETVEEERETLTKTQAQLETAQAKARATLAAAQDKVAQAEEALAEAQEKLADLKAGPDALELAQAHNAVAQAEYNLAKAKDDLDNILAGPDPKEVELAQARYNAAKAAYEEAAEKLQAATMVAPFNGTVISIGAEVGDLVSSGTTVVTLADLAELRVLALVDETDISQVEVGQEVEITFDAFPGRRFQGKVLEVPLHGKLVQNVVKYEVPVSLEGTKGVALKPGMTANLKMVVGRRENALLVPVLAVQDSEEGKVVRVQDTLSGSTMLVPVEVGLSDGTYVEVVRGLNEGDQIVVEYQALQQTPRFGFGFFGSMGPGGGVRRTQ